MAECLYRWCLIRMQWREEGQHEWPERFMQNIFIFCKRKKNHIHRLSLQLMFCSLGAHTQKVHGYTVKNSF